MMRFNLKKIILIFFVAIVAYYFLTSMYIRVVRKLEVEKSRKGAEQAMTEVRGIANTAPLPKGWTKLSRRITVAFPLGNREEEIAYWENTHRMSFVFIPAGEFIMGQNKSKNFPDADPEHLVRITQPFFMGAHEVTRAQYEEITGKYVPFRQGPQHPSEPACGITWEDAEAFCRLLSESEGLAYRLPTEAQWEYACRAGTTTGSYAGYRDKAELCSIVYKPKAVATREKHMPRYHPEPVGTFPSNAFGLFNMAGNAWEWCQDWYAEDYYTKSPTDDPQGPPSGTFHVRRGGSFLTGRLGCRSYYRVSPKAGIAPTGFRVALSKANFTE